MLSLLPVIQLVSRSTPNLNTPAITALVDRWRPEIHTFHLRTTEMTPTLIDVFMILGLPIEEKPLRMSTDSSGWRAQMEALIGQLRARGLLPRNALQLGKTAPTIHFSD